MAPKTLLVFCDGTSMDGTQSLGASRGALEGVAAPQSATNVLRLSRSVKPYTSEGKLQVVLYQSGVGSESDFDGDSVTGADAIIALGTAVASKIRDAYAFIAQNFSVGDDICIFGFSRGAYTARKLAGLIDKIGLLQTQDLKLFYSIWRALVDGDPPNIPDTTRRTSIKCLGVWDTVGSVYNTIDALSITDTSLPASVLNAFHALAMQENRQKFLPTLFTVPTGGLRDKQSLIQLWFPGAHSDVGGGYENHELSDLALFWMAGEIAKRNLIDIDLDFLALNRQPNPSNPWGAAQPHNSYEESSFLVKIAVGHETRFESGQITKTDAFHESILHAPTALTDAKYMITLDTLKKAFGTGWAPTCPPLNEFEQKCKDNWGRKLLGNAGSGSGVSYENLGDLFPHGKGLTRK